MGSHMESSDNFDSPMEPNSDNFDRPMEPNSDNFDSPMEPKSQSEDFDNMDSFDNEPDPDISREVNNIDENFTKCKECLLRFANDECEYKCSSCWDQEGCLGIMISYEGCYDSLCAKF